jgi:hypothetical protein
LRPARRPDREEGAATDEVGGDDMLGEGEMT